MRLRALEHTSMSTGSTPVRSEMIGTNFKACSPLGEFVCANSKKVGTDPTFMQRIFSLTNHIAKICFSLCVAQTNSPSGERA